MRKTIYVLLFLTMSLCLLMVYFLVPEWLQWASERALVRSVLIYLFFILLIWFIVGVSEFLYNKRVGKDSSDPDNFHFGIRNIARVLLGAGFIVAAFGIFGVDIKSLVTSLTIVAAAVAITTKEFIHDFLVGIYFSFSKNFEIGDYVRVGDTRGRVMAIDMFKTKVLNDDDDLVILPNSRIYANDVLNFTKRDIRLMSVDFQMDIKHVDDIDFLEKELTDALVDFSDYLETDSFNLKIIEMKKDVIDFKFQYSLKALDVDLQRKIRRKTVRQIFSHISAKEK